MVHADHSELARILQETRPFYYCASRLTTSWTGSQLHIHPSVYFLENAPVNVHDWTLATE